MYSFAHSAVRGSRACVAQATRHLREKGRAHAAVVRRQGHPLIRQGLQAYRQGRGHSHIILALM